MDMSIPEEGSKLNDQLRNEKGELYFSYSRLSRHLDMKARIKGIPLIGKFELTPLCNFDCRMCYVHLNENQLNGNSVLSVETWKNLMHQAWEAGMISASVTGGECLTYPGFDELYLYLQSLGCEVTVLTNGFLLNEKRIQFFQEHRPSDMQITLYGCNDDVYERVTGKRGFTTVVKNFKQASDAGLPVFISITPNRFLGEDIFETIRIAKELSNKVIINTFYTSPREETGRSGYQDDADTDLYIRAIKYRAQLEGQKPIEINEERLPPAGGPCHETSECGFLCGGGRSAFAIDWKGIMTPCTDLDMIRSYPLKDGFATAWSRINQEVNNWPRVPECMGCAYEDVCNHCAAKTLRYAVPGKVPTALCEQTREMVRNGALYIPECE